MNELNKLKVPAGAKKERKRVGRGQASGQGKTAGRGNKGQKARTGNMHFEGFEGGQSPLARRLPKRGFTNINRIEYSIVNLESLAAFESGKSVGLAEFVAAGIVRNPKLPVKILGDGELAVALTVQANKFSASAKAKIEAAGGKTLGFESAKE